MNVASLSPADVDRVAAFFDRIPEGDRTFFKEPVSGAATVQALAGRRLDPLAGARR